ncbi:hypothetical protein J6590_108163, partial [Homalodisca vitripennis]
KISHSESRMGTVEVEVSELISSTQEITRSGVRWNPIVDLSQEVKALNYSIDSSGEGQRWPHHDEEDFHCAHWTKPVPELPASCSCTRKK